MRYFSKNVVKNQQGMSLISILVGLGVASVLLYVFGQWAQNTSQVVRQIRTSGNIEELRNYVRVSVNCDATVSKIPNGCLNTAQAPSTALALYGPSSNTPVVAVSGSKIASSKYSLRATCSSKKGEFIVLYKEDGSTSWKELFKPHLRLNCEGAL